MDLSIIQFIRDLVQALFYVIILPCAGLGIIFALWNKGK